MVTALEEYEALKRKLPRTGTVQFGCENCDWGDHVFNSANGYYVFDGSQIQDSMYSYNSFKEVGCIDTHWNSTCERCYETLDSIECTDCYFSQYLGQSYNMYYCFNCDSCNDCFGCVQLSNKSYCIFNVQYTEEEYKEKLPELKKMVPEEVMKKIKELELKFPKIQSYFADNINSDYTDYVYKSRNAYYCFDCISIEDCGFVSVSNECKDSWDCSYIFRCEHCAECVDSDECYNCYAAQNCSRCYDSAFIFGCADCNNCFMCSSLTNAKYCILNVQYTPEEYKTKVSELKAQLGLSFKQ
jgi:hypothetical protein